MHGISRSIMLAGVLLCPLTASAVNNGDFTHLSARPTGQQHHNTSGNIGFAPGWTLFGNQGGVIETGLTPAAMGDSVFRFHTLTGAFGDNKLDQCLLIDPGHNIHFSFQVRTDVSPVTNDLRLRLNPMFYASVEDCERDLQQDSTGRRLTGGGLDNADRDVRLGAVSGLTSHQWYTITQATHGTTGPLVHPATSLPAGATALRVSLRARDDAAATSRHLWLDDIRVTQDSGPNQILNGDFSHLALHDEDQPDATSGWQVNRDGDGSLRAGAGAFATLHGADNRFYFEDLTGNFGSNGLDQCFLLNGSTPFRPSLRSQTNVPHDDLALRVNVDFFSSGDCTSGELGSLRLREDFALNAAPGEWQRLVVQQAHAPATLAAASSARISLRGRDRSNSAGNGPDGFPRRIVIDDVETNGLVSCDAPAQVQSYEAKAFLDPAIVLTSGQVLHSSVQSALNISSAPQLFNVQYLDTDPQTMMDEGWSIRTRKRADQSQHRIQFKKRYPVEGNDLASALADAHAQGFDACTGLDVEVDWSPSGRKTLSFQRQTDETLGLSGLTMPGVLATRQLAHDHAHPRFSAWIDGQWGADQIDDARLYGPVFFERYAGEFNGLELAVEVWHIINETGDGPDYMIEASFKTASASVAASELAALLTLLDNQGWLLDEDVLKTRRVLDRY